jgi:arginyl-tRNA--protein-N-Asp/Glu arginylyltransferase
MKHQSLHGLKSFFATDPQPCPYLPDRVERRVVTELLGRDAARFHDVLSNAGFRRSHSVAYTPACPECNACVAVRVVSDDFVSTRSMKRVSKINSHLSITECDPIATEEQYILFCLYQHSRHSSGDMAKMAFVDYCALIEETPVKSSVLEFRDEDDILVGACLVDRIYNGLSAVYSFFDPNMSSQSLGTYVILWLIEQSKDLGLPYVYLGFWVNECDNMSYKVRFKPLEKYTPSGWEIMGDLETNQP